MAAPKQNENQNEQKAQQQSTILADMNKAIVEPAKKAVEAVMKDGTLAAAFRQGAQEIYDGLLKPFPDVTSVREVGTVFSPTQGEVASARKEDQPSPSQIAENPKSFAPDHGLGNQNQKDFGKEMDMSL